MKNATEAGDDALLAEFGHRLAQARLNQSLTQEALALRAGVSKRTVERLESGSVGTQLSAFIRVCRALSLLERLDLLVPDPVPSPIAQLKLRGKRRQRASSPRTPAKPPAQPWQWGAAP